jgi:hypothetical protein
MKWRLSTISAILAIFATGMAAYAGDDVTSLSYISYLERYATLHPGRGGEVIDAVVNMPVLAGDQLDTARGARVEVQLAEGSTVWLDEFSNLSFDAIANSRDSAAPRTALYLSDGTVAVEIPATATGEGTIRVDSTNGTVNLNRAGLYRLDLQSGQLHVAAFTGLAELPAGMGSSLLRTGQEATVGGDGQVETAALSDRTDDFWNWVQERRQPAPSTRTAEVVEGNAGSHAAALDSYGEWVWQSDFDTWMWRPRVAADWSPYAYGRWYWTPVGWDWISYEPWGWYPFHYGSWYFDAGFGWLWGWDRVWAPAWVHWLSTPGYVGWCPRGYYDWWWAHNCTHCWGEGWRRPPRWGEVAFDFHGRVNLTGIDPRPWTIVPSGQFNSSHLERLRLDPGRVRDQLGGREGIVRSGQFLTPPPSRMTPGQDFGSFFRGDQPGRQVPDLSDVLRRTPETTTRSGLPTAVMRPMRTTEVVASTRLHLSENPAVTRYHGAIEVGDRGAGIDRWRPQGTPRGGSGSAGNPPTVRREVITPRATGARGGSGTSTPPPPPRQVTGPPARGGSGSSSSGSSGSSGRSGSTSNQSRPQRQSMSWVAPSSPRGHVPYRTIDAARTRTYSIPRVAVPSQGYRAPSGGRSFSPPSSSFGARSSGGSSYHPSSGGSSSHSSSHSGGGPRRH